MYGVVKLKANVIMTFPRSQRNVGISIGYVFHLNSTVFHSCIISSVCGPNTVFKMARILECVHL